MENLPADILYTIGLKLDENALNINEKLVAAKEIIKMCKVNKRFKNLYCSNDPHQNIWIELWNKNITSKPIIFGQDWNYFYYGRLDEYSKKNNGDKLVDAIIAGDDKMVENLVNWGVNFRYGAASGAAECAVE